MSVSNDLMHAILAMDAYNRGYGAGIAGLNEAVGTQIGNASITKRLQDVSATFEPNSQAAGFYALAYDWNGQRVISYRGTNLVGNLPAANDVVNGWPIGLGSPAASQGLLAAQFYRNIVGGEENLFNADVTLTGHSLGGGLAGLLASIYGRQATPFDSMSFEAAANNVVAYLLIPLGQYESYLANVGGRSLPNFKGPSGQNDDPSSSASAAANDNPFSIAYEASA